jgi:hypothetical protein
MIWNSWTCSHQIQWYEIHGFVLTRFDDMNFMDLFLTRSDDMKLMDFMGVLKLATKAHIQYSEGLWNLEFWYNKVHNGQHISVDRLWFLFIYPIECPHEYVNCYFHFNRMQARWGQPIIDIIGLSFDQILNAKCILWAQTQEHTVVTVSSLFPLALCC